MASFGDIARERGDFNEQKVVAAFRDTQELPDWILSIVKAERKLDLRGIDFVAETDVGKIFLQIKSSNAGKRKHEEKYQNKMIAVVVINVRETKAEVFVKCVRALGEIRREILTIRKREWD